MSYRVLPPNSAAELTISLEEGLLLPANPLMKFIVESAIARALYLHPLDICHFLAEASHIHFLLYVRDPSAVPGFVERFKTESAHYINALLGRSKRTVWCEDYACLPILTVSSAMKKIRYIYTNPAKDGLEDCIEQYPGLSSWSVYTGNGKRKRLTARLHRTMIPYLPEKFYSEHTYIRHRRELKKRASASHVFEINPDAWMKAFNVPDTEEKNKSIKSAIKEQEAVYREERQKAGKKVIGRTALRAAHLDLDYVPERTGRRMWCICDDISMRRRYIEWAKSLKQEAREVYERWKSGDFSVRFPPGVFPPAIPKLSNIARLDIALR